MTWYNTGTVTTTTNSAVVIGSGTAWTASGLRAGDMLLIGYNTASPRPFEIKSIDSATQITLVIAFPVAVTAAAYVGIPMLSGDRTAITMTLAQQITKAFTDNQAMQAVWQAFYSGSGTITLTMPDGSTVTGSSFLKLTADMAGKASLVAGAVPVNQGGTGATTAAGARTALGAFPSSGGTISGNLTVNGSTVVSSTYEFRFKGFTDSSRPSGANTNDLVVSTPPNASAGTYACQMVYQWYADGWITGIKRNAGYGTNAFGIYFNGASTGSGKEWQFLVDGTATGGAWVNGSDEHHKSQITPVENPLAAVCSWRGASYQIKDSGPAVGLIAQDVEKWCPAAVKSYGDRKFSDGTVVTDFKYLDTTGAAAAYHTEAIKQLFQLVELALEDPDACRAQIASIKQVMSDTTNEPAS